MSIKTTIQGRLDATGLRFGIVASRFNERIVRLLMDGAIEEIERLGGSEITVVRVPGAHEIPPALDALAKSGTVDVLVALGVVIRGETAHFDYVCSSCQSGVDDVVRRTGMPVGLGVLTCETSEQAQERAGGKHGNKAAEAAQAAIEMASVLRQIGELA